MRAIILVISVVLIASQAAAQWGPCAPLKRNAGDDAASNSQRIEDLTLQGLDRVFRPVHYAVQDQSAANGHNVVRSAFPDV
jgi:hypothetical protein